MAADGLSFTVLLPAPAHLTADDASVVRFRPSLRATALVTVSFAEPDIASVHVTRTDSPRLAKPLTDVLTGSLTPNHGAWAGAASGAFAPGPGEASAAVTVTGTDAEARPPRRSSTVSVAVYAPGGRVDVDGVRAPRSRRRHRTPTCTSGPCRPDRDACELKRTVSGAVPVRGSASTATVGSRLAASATVTRTVNVCVPPTPSFAVTFAS